MTSLTAFLLHFRMPVKIVFQTLRHIVALWYDAYAGTHMAHDCWQEQWIVGASQYHGINQGVEFHQLVEFRFHEIVGTGTFGFLVLHQWHPHRTSQAGDGDIGVLLRYLQVITLALDGSFGGKHAHMAGGGELSDDFGSGTDDAQHTAMGVEQGKVFLLYGAQCLGRGGVAPKDYQVAPHLKEFDDSLSGEFIHHVEGTRAVWSARVVA